MELTVSRQKKLDVRKSIEQNKKSIRTLRFLQRLFRQSLLSLVCGSGCFIALIGCFIALIYTTSGSNMASEIRQKSIAELVVIFLGAFGMLLLFSGIAKVLADGYVRSLTTDRLGEDLRIGSGKLRYSYRIKDIDKPGFEHRSVTIDLSSAESVQFDAATGMFTFIGDIQNEYFEKGKVKFQKKLDKFTICDYFVPSLAEAIYWTFPEEMQGLCANNKRITAADKVSATVTDLVAEGGLEPPTSGL